MFIENDNINTHTTPKGRTHHAEISFYKHTVPLELKVERVDLKKGVKFLHPTCKGSITKNMVVANNLVITKG